MVRHFLTLLISSNGFKFLKELEYEFSGNSTLMLYSRSVFQVPLNIFLDFFFK